MRLDLQKGRYQARLAANKREREACQALRHRCFFDAPGLDRDSWDADWQHLMVADVTDDSLVCTLRFQICTGDAVQSGYAAGAYDLKKIAARKSPNLEIGRFCTDPARPDPHILRVAWGALTRIVAEANVALIFGCTSFRGTDAAPYRDVFHRLHTHHLGPEHLRPGVRSAATIALAATRPARVAQCPMPPLLRTYLAMGGWVSDHAVIDPTMNTLHVLTALETAHVPTARAKALQALA